ncbi:MAG TPA: DUF58 domain-containing protein [Gammaproteobacteria bacterium]|jgi:uncharacterized protein (DUF58 family)
MLSAQSARLRSLAADWARRRQGEDSHAVALQRRRVYILPTRYGLIFALTVFAMLLGSLNYGASLGFGLTFLLCGLGLVLMQHCHNNLLGVTISFAGADPVFAGAEARFRIALQNGAAETRWDLAIDCGASGDGPVDLASGAATTLQVNLPTRTRGWVHLTRFSVSSRHPGNLFRAWSWIHMDARCLVYPEPAPPGRPYAFSSDAGGMRSAPQQEEDDFVGLRDASPADPPRRLAWKAYARSDQLMTKEFAGSAAPACLFDWRELAELDDDAKLSQLTRWCLDAAHEGRSFGLVLPDRKIPLGTGERHLHDCLQALALHGLAE